MPDHAALRFILIVTVYCPGCALPGEAVPSGRTPARAALPRRAIPWASVQPVTVSGAAPRQSKALWTPPLVRASQSNHRAVGLKARTEADASVSAFGSEVLSTCPGYSEGKCDYDQGPRICMKILDEQGEPLKYYGDKFNPGWAWSSWMWGNEIRKVRGDSYCLNMLSSAPIIKEAGCATVQIRCDATDWLWTVQGKNTWEQAYWDIDIQSVKDCLKEKCKPANFKNPNEMSLDVEDEEVSDDWAIELPDLPTAKKSPFAPSAENQKSPFEPSAQKSPFDPTFLSSTPDHALDRGEVSVSWLVHWAGFGAAVGVMIATLVALRGRSSRHFSAPLLLS